MRRLHTRITLHFLGVLAVVGLAIAVIHRAGVARPVAATVAVLALVAAATAPLARRISRPIGRLTEASRRFGAGDLSVRVPVPELCGPRGPRHRRHRGVDELIELTRAWNEMADRVERMVRGQKELLANVSHELRSPLARVRVALELVPRADEEAAARLRDLEADLDELDRFIDDVLTASRLDAAGLPTRLEPVEARELLAGLAERAASAPGLAGRAVSVADGPPVRLHADVALLRRALWNLVENAGKHGAPPIELAASRQDGRALLSVTDRGDGIPPEDQARLLEPFARGTAARSTPGYGLGLTIARRVAEVHGGRIRVETPADGGCRVSLELPAA